MYFYIFPTKNSKICIFRFFQQIMCVLSLFKCTQADKDQNITMCVLYIVAPPKFLWNIQKDIFLYFGNQKLENDIIVFLNQTIII